MSDVIRDAIDGFKYDLNEARARVKGKSPSKRLSKAGREAISKAAKRRWAKHRKAAGKGKRS